MNYFLVPLGCQMNISDSERIRTVLESVGYTACDREEDADILGIVACSVRQKSIDKVYSRIHRWNTWKDSRSLLTFVSGCILPADRSEFLKRFDLVLAIEEIESLPEMIRHYGVVTAASAGGTAGKTTDNEENAGGERDIRTGFWQVTPHYSSPVEAFVPIQNGCDKFCTFCAVPYTRGREISRPSGDILAEVSDLVDRGYRSITLLGQNVNSYGLDRRSSEMRFASLLREVGSIIGDRKTWVYFTSPHPHDMSDDVLEAIAGFESLANQIHLPIQSGDDAVLRRMNRNYRIADYRRVVQSIRSILPDATLFTDIIVGFNGETMEEFDRTSAAVEEFAFQMAYIAMYSPRPGAASAKWDDDVPQTQKKRRYHALSETLLAVAAPYTRGLIGKTLTVLVTGYARKEGFLTAHTEGRIPVLLPADHDRFVVKPGDFVPVLIQEARPLSIAGVPVFGERE